MKDKIKKLIEERKKMIKDGEADNYVQYDKGYIHAMGEVLDIIATEEKAKGEQ